MTRPATYTAETARAVYNDYWNDKDSTCAAVAAKHGLNRDKVFLIIHKRGVFNARVLKDEPNHPTRYTKSAAITTETARNAFNDYWGDKKATIEGVARKYADQGLTTNKVSAIIHKKGTWWGVTITLTRPERQMNRNEMIRAAGGDPNQER